VLLETGNKRMATTLAGEWVLWTSGKVDFLTVTMELNQMLTWAAIGAGIAFLSVFLIVWQLARRRRPTGAKGT